MNQSAVWADTEGLVLKDASVSRQTEAVLRERILNGKLVPGERLNEVEIANSMGVSRGPLREAIQKLAGEGLLNLQSRRGAYVRKYEPREIIEIYEMRVALELYAIRLVAQRATDEDLAGLEAMLVDSSNSLQPESGAYVAELDFHQRMVDLADNSAIRKSCLEANHRLYLALSTTKRTKDRAGHAAGEHVEIATALRSRNISAATTLMETHLEASMRNALTVLGLS